MERRTGPIEAQGPSLTLAEAAALLQHHHNTVRAWVRQGRLEAVVNSGEAKPMYRLRDVEALRRSLEREGGSSKEELRSIHAAFTTINEELRARNEALQESEERYRKLIEVMPVAAYTCDATGHIRLFNEAAVRLWGRTPVVGESCWCGAASMRMVDGTDLPLEQCPMAVAMLEQRAMTDVEAVVVRPDGEHRSVLANPTPLFDKQGRITGAINVLLDITERNDTSRLLALATKVGNLGIWDWDVANNVIVWTDAVYGIHGVEKKSFEPTMEGYHQLIHPEDRERVAAAITATLEKAVPYEIEFRTLNAEGTVNWVYTNAVVLRENGKPMRMMGGTMNITARREAEDALRMSEQRYHALTVNLPQLIFIVDNTGKTTWVNDKWAAYFGLESTGVIDQQWVQAVHPEDMGPMLASWSAAFAEKRDWEHTFRIRNQQGAYRWFLSRATPLPGTGGGSLRWFGTHTDVTDQREADTRIRESEERFRLLADNMDQLAWMATPDGSALWFNKRWEDFSGIPVDQIPARAATDLHHPDHFERVTASLRAAAEKGENWEDIFPLKSRIGKWHWFLSRVMPHKDAEGNVVRWFGTSTDITEQREKEEQLQKSEANFRLLADNMDQLAMIQDAEGNALWFNKRWETLMGVDFSALSREERSRWIHPVHMESMWETLRKGLGSGKAWDAQFQMRIKGGAYRWFLMRSVPVLGAEGEAARWFTTNTDITDAKEAERVLQDRQDRLLSAAEAAQLGVFMWHIDKDEPSWENDRMFAIFGRTREQGVLTAAEVARDVIHPEDLAGLQEKVAAAVAKGSAFEHVFRTRTHGKNGPRILQVTARVQQVGGTPDRIVGVMADITDRETDAEAARRLAAIVASTQDAVISKDLNGIITSWNQAATELFGYTAEETVGRSVRMLIPQEMQGEEGIILARLRKGERIEHYETVRLRKDGTRMDVALTVSPIFTAEGVVIGASKMARDISDRKRLEADIHTANQQLQLVTDHMPVAVARCGRDGNFVWASKGYLDWIGRTALEVEGRYMTDVIGERARAVLAPYVEQVLKGETVECEVQVQLPTRGQRWLEVKYVPLYEGGAAPAGWIEVITDITLRKGLERALQDADRHKDHFLATLAHELRNPLAPIKNGLHLLELSDDDPELSRRTQTMMTRQVDHMVRLVDDLMDLSRISRGKIELVLERVDLGRVIATAIDASDPLIKQHGHRLDVHMPEGEWEVRGDMVRLTQVVSNLLNNSAKYTERGGRIELSVERDGDEVAIHVKDNGIGIEAQALPIVFDMFAQVSNATKKVEGGLGIGLNIVKRLVEMHAGRIQVTSAGAGRGSEFTVWLPLLERSEDPVPEPGHQPLPASTMHAKRVLVVDDNEDAAFTMALLLRKHGHTVEVAHDGAAAVELVPGYKPEIVFMDIGMPRMNGYEACKAIRQMPGAKHITIVALSGWGQEEDRQRATAAGFDSHLVKPIDGETLLHVISANTSVR
ncbi:MAG: PAS domain S-box protein [Flavobacteriales bacterium]